MAWKAALRAGAVAVELRRLRVQQQRQRILRGMAARDFGMAAGRSGIAMADREQALGDGMPAARDDAVRGGGAGSVRACATARATGVHSHHRRDDGNAERQREYRQRSAMRCRQPPHDSTTSPR